MWPGISSLFQPLYCYQSIWRRNGGASILVSSVCTDVDLKCDYGKIILIGAMTSLFHRTLPFYDDVNELEFVMCMEKSE